MYGNSNKNKQISELIEKLDPDKFQCCQCEEWYPTENMVPLAVKVPYTEDEAILCERCADDIANEGEK